MPGPVGQKGYTGNPGGRPAMDPELKKAVQGYARDAIEYLAGVLSDPNAKPDHRIKAAEVLIDRGFGKAVQAIDATLTERRPIIFSPEWSNDPKPETETSSPDSKD
jgi:hypothetical protein